MRVNSFDDIADFLRLYWGNMIEMESMYSIIDWVGLIIHWVGLASDFFTWFFGLHMTLFLIGLGLRWAGYDPNSGVAEILDLIMIPQLRSAYRLAGFDPDTRKPNALQKTDQTRSDRSAAETVSCLPNLNHDGPDLTDFLKGTTR